MGVKLIECPRDAMQGITQFIPTQTKVDYINKLLGLGFDTLDFGSFVSPKAIPQLQDTAEVLGKLNLDPVYTKTKLLAIVANLRGAQSACGFKPIQYIGFPFSVSETFQQRNTNSSIADSLETVKAMQELCVGSGKELVVYLSMGFGNPYGDPWNAELVINWSEKLYAMGVRILSLSDTVGVAKPDDIHYLFSSLIPALPQVEFGAHLHCTPDAWKDKVEAAWEGGCRRYDGALKGYGGCPMASDSLTGNMPTENLISFIEEKGLHSGIHKEQLQECLAMAQHVFAH